MKMVPKLSRQFLIFLNSEDVRTFSLLIPPTSLFLAFHLSYFIYFLFTTPCFSHFPLVSLFFLASQIFLMSPLSHFSCQTNVYASNLTMQLPMKNVFERNKGKSKPYTISGQPNFALGGYRPFVFT